MDKKLKQKLLLIIILAAILNFIWEVLHSRFYTYAYIPDSSITIWALLLSTLGDVIYTLIAALIFIKFLPLRSLLWVFVIGIIFAVIWEYLGLAIGAWQYNSAMPIIPLINIGLSPAIQLGFLTYLIFEIVNIKSVKT